MKTLKGILLILLILSTSCSTGDHKLRPEYRGIDPRAQGLLDEYMKLSALNNIVFKNKVTIGFKNINNENAVGMCTYGGAWREIDIDITYWNLTSSLPHMALMFHELTHCYCDRDHDYGEGLGYPEKSEERINRAREWLREGGPRPGYWADGCPVSLMYPVVADSDCMKAHYQEYIREMFDRCKPF